MEIAEDRPTDFSVVIPAYNEALRLPKTLTEILGVLAPMGLAYEILVVDDGSTDGTADETRRFAQIDNQVQLISTPTNRGKGDAVRTGVLAARGRRIAFVDADGATAFTEIAKLQTALDAGAEVAIGTRAAGAHLQNVQARWYRTVLGTVFNALVRWLVVKGFSDTQCGFKLFNREAALDLFGRAHETGYAFDVEILFLARRGSWKVVEVPVDWAEQRGSKVHLLVDSVRMLLALLRIRWRSLVGTYNRVKAGSPGRDLAAMR